MKRIIRAAYLLGLALIIGCASLAPQREFSFQDVGRLKVGMTEKQVLNIMGEPSSRQRTIDGGFAWEWRNGQKFARIGIINGKVVSVPQRVGGGNDQAQSQFQQGQQMAQAEIRKAFSFYNYGLIEEEMTETEILKLVPAPESVRSGHWYWPSVGISYGQGIDMRDGKVWIIKYVSQGLSESDSKEYHRGLEDVQKKRHAEIVNKWLTANPKSPEHIVTRLKNRQIDPTQADHLLRVDAYLRRFPSMRAHIRDAILRGEPVIGMTLEQALIAKPGLTRIHRITTISGSSEIWSTRSYSGTYGTTYHFDLEILTAITD